MYADINQTSTWSRPRRILYS